ncbi:hypothetical protein, partial [Streptococcus vulneris]
YRSGYSTPEETRRVVALQRALTLAGFHIARTGKAFLSTPMTDEDIDSFIDAVNRIVDARLEPMSAGLVS